MSPSSSRFAASSISKILQHRSSLTTNPIYRNPKPTSSFSASERSLSTLTQESPSASSSEPQGKERGKLSRWLLFLPGAITFGLGTWQIFRRQDKIEMLEHRRKRLELEPLSYNNISSFSGDLDSLEFRRVMCEGTYDESKSLYVGPRSRSISGVTENGYYIITPFIPLSDNPESVQSPVLVNRGWVPRSWRDNHLKESFDVAQHSNLKSTFTGNNEESSWWKFWSKKSKTIKDQDSAVSAVKVIGIVRGSEKPSIFVPENDPTSGQWFYVDVPMIARASGLPANTVYIEDVNDNVDPSNPYPVPKDVNTLIRSSVMPQDHLNYTMTWYSLSAAVTFMAFKRLKTKKSRR